MDSAQSLLPAAGLNSARIDDRSLQVGELRAAINLRLVDGELQAREGEQVKQWQVCSRPIHEIFSIENPNNVDGSRRHFLVSAWGCLEYDSETEDLSVPYASEWTGNLQVYAGSRQADRVTTATGVFPVNPGSILIAPGARFSNSAYFIEAVLGNAITLDRPYEGPTGLAARAIYPRFGSGFEEFSIAQPHYVSHAIHRQLIAHVAADPATQWANPAVAAGGTYLVIAVGTTGGSIDGPVAIRLDFTAALITEFFRNTALAVPLAITGSPPFVASYKGRLIINSLDENGSNGERTLWYSQDGDMVMWHRTDQAGVRQPNRIRFADGLDPITGMGPLRDDFIIHRERSQEILQYNGSDIAPFIIVRNDQGVGCVCSKSLIIVEGVQYFWSQYGPAMFDGSLVRYLDVKIRRIAAEYRGTAEWPETTILSQFPRAVLGGLFTPRREIYWSISDYADRLSITSEMTGPGNLHTVLVYQYETGDFWLEERNPVWGLGTISSGQEHSSRGGQERLYSSRGDGTLVAWTQTNRIGDMPPTLLEATDNPNRTDVPWAYMESQWTDYGSVGQKQLSRIDLTFRVIPNGTANLVEDYADEFLTPPFDTVELFVLELLIWTDMNMVNVYKVIPIEITRNELLNFFETEGARTPPRFVKEVPVRAFGWAFKYALTNRLSDLSAAYVATLPMATIPPRIPFRLSQIDVHFPPDAPESTDREVR